MACAHSVDGVARAFEPLLVNTVVGFIGPEYLFDGKQIVGAGLQKKEAARRRPPEASHPM